jgi:hypothetical protein
MVDNSLLKPSLITKEVAVARKIWSRPGNPTNAVAAVLRVTRIQLGDAIHVIKDDAGLRPDDRVTIWDDGSVTDDADACIGNIYDEI